jgi:hypothetical protein
LFHRIDTLAYFLAAAIHVTHKPAGHAYALHQTAGRYHQQTNRQYYFNQRKAMARILPLHAFHRILPYEETTTWLVFPLRKSSVTVPE